jgi:hypothetical protein
MLWTGPNNEPEAEGICRCGNAQINEHFKAIGGKITGFPSARVHCEEYFKKEF